MNKIETGEKEIEVELNKVKSKITENYLFTSGLGGTAKYLIKNDDTYQMIAKKDAPRIVQVKASKFDPDRLIVQEEEVNHLICLDKDLTPYSHIEEGTKEDKSNIESPSQPRIQAFQTLSGQSLHALEVRTRRPKDLRCLQRQN
jgi:hypothetical protein